MKLFCPHCGVKGVADDSYRGKKVKCPKCQETFIAEEAVAADVKSADAQPQVDSGEVETQALREQRVVNEPAVRAEETTPDEEIPIEEADEAEAAREEAEEVEQMLKEAVEEETTEAPPAPEGGLEEEKEAVLDWDEIAAEIEAKAGAEEGEAREKEELPAGLFADSGEEERQSAVEAADQPVIAEPAADDGRDQSLTDSGDLQGVEGVEPDGRQENSSGAVKAEEGRENHFIFEEQGRETEPVQEVEDQPYGLAKELCWQCGKKNRSGAAFTARSGRMYCPACLPAAEPEAALDEVPASAGPAGPAEADPAQAADTVPPVMAARPRFTIGGVLREAWEKTRGAKGAIWAGSAVMYLTLIVLAAGGTFLLPGFAQDVTADTAMATRIANRCFEALINVISVLFTAGLLFMGIRKVAGDSINWKMIFVGFSDTGKLIVATILQFIMVFLGFMVLVLPGIYLAVGYSMTIPLIVDRKMSPWQAMETSRKAVHKVWWRVVGLYFVMGMLCLVSMVPLGIGLIWTWPMFIILAGVVYRCLFGSEK